MNPKFKFINANTYLDYHFKGIWQCALTKAFIYAKILATEDYVCVGIGFTKYLN